MQKSTNPRTVLAASGARILVVDNDEAFAKFFKIHLSRYFSDVFVTGNPREALSWFETNPFDLVITDLNLPRIDGFSFAKRLRKINKKVSIILTSNFVLTPFQQSKIEKNDGFLIKPFNMNEFHICVRKGLNEKLCNSKLTEEMRAEAGAFLEEEHPLPKKRKAS